MDSLQQDLQVALGDAYTLERELGRGGMGAVFLARDNRLHRPVAIKLLPPELASSPDLRERFLRETRLAASFSHPNIVPVHDVVEQGNLCAFVMGFVEGETLGARVRRGGPLPVPEAVRLLQEVAWALSYAHGRGVVHRDIKPDNILVERATSRSLVTDFGIARSAATTPGQGLTRVGEVVGTPEFMSPEQASGDVVDGRSDLYSLGVVAFYALSGTLPFESATPTGLLAMHLTQAPPSLAAIRPDLPPELVASVERCLAKEPDARFASGEELANALDGLRRSAPEVAPAVRVFLQRVGTSFFALCFLAACCWYLFNQGSKRSSGLDWLLNFTMILAAMCGLMVQVFGRVRMLLRQGFRYRDIYAAAGAIKAEDVAARDAIRASADEMRRRKRRIRMGLASVLWAPLAGYWVFTTMRFPVEGRPGMYRLSMPGAIIIFSAAIALGLGITLLASDPLKGNPLVFLQSLFWRGPIGRLIFRLGGWRLPLAAEPGIPSTGAAIVSAGGPMTVLHALPKILKRDLHGVEQRLHALDAEVTASRTRESELAAALADARSHQGAASDRASAVAEEIGEAATRAREAREKNELRLEHARLELIRLRAGIGSAAAVRQVLEG